MVRFLHAPARYLELMRAGIPLYDRLEDEVARAATGLEVRRILDLGVGTAETTLRCLAVHPRAAVVAIDASAEMLEVAAARVDGRVELRRGRLEDPLPDGTFELAVSALAVHHLDGAGKADLFRRVAQRPAPRRRLLMAAGLGPDPPGPRPP